eukprot:gene10280-2428_t
MLSTYAKNPNLPFLVMAYSGVAGLSVTKDFMNVQQMQQLVVELVPQSTTTSRSTFSCISRCNYSTMFLQVVKSTPKDQLSRFSHRKYLEIQLAMETVLPRDNRLALHSTQQLLDCARTAKFSTIPHLAEEDVANIWFGVSQFIATALSEGKAVNVRGLGRFALSVVDWKTPIFQLSEQFVQKHNLKSPIKQEASNAATLALNFSEISRVTKHHRDDVERCFDEILKALDTQIREPSPRGLSLLFFGVGKLTIRNAKVRFAFFTKFLDNPHKLADNDVKEGTLNRPKTVGLVAYLQQLSQTDTCSEPGTVTPRLLCTPTVTNMQFDLIGTTSSDALQPKLRPSHVNRNKIVWQSSLLSNAVIPILDGSSLGDEDNNQLVPAPPARYCKPKPIDIIPEEASSDDVNEYEQLAHWNMQSSLSPPLDPTTKELALQASIKAGSLAHRDLHAPTMQRKDCTNPDRAQQTSSIPAYEEWVKQRDKSKKTSERHRLHVREQLERDEEIPKKFEQEEREKEVLLCSLEKIKADKAAALERAYEEVRKRAARDAADYNLRVAQSKDKTSKDESMSGGADVFVFRPATSKSAIRHRKQEVMLEQMQQETLQRTKAQEERERQKAFEQDETVRLIQSLTESKLSECQKHANNMNAYRSALDTQIECKKQMEAEACQTHRRHRIPFELKHLADYTKDNRASSAAGHPAAIAGPETYRQQDMLEKRLQGNFSKLNKLLTCWVIVPLNDIIFAENARRLCADQVKMFTTQQQQLKEKEQREKSADRRAIDKIITGLVEDMRSEKQRKQQNILELRHVWDDQHRTKCDKEQEEIEERRKAAPAPIKDQMDYHAFINGFA